MSDHDDVPTPEGAPPVGKPARYESPPESIALARETMRGIKAALTKSADGQFPAQYAGMDWDGMNLQPPKKAWQDMDTGERYDLLLHVLDESICSLERSAKWDEPRDSQRLANEFVQDELRQLYAEMRHDYGLRLLEDRQVQYDDAAERPLDHPGARGTGGGQVTELPPTMAEGYTLHDLDGSKRRFYDHSDGFTYYLDAGGKLMATTIDRSEHFAADSFDLVPLSQEERETISAALAESATPAGIAQGQAIVSPPRHALKPAALPPHPWPSEIARANRGKQAGLDQVKASGKEKTNGQDTGHSM